MYALVVSTRTSVYLYVSAAGTDVTKLNSLKKAGVVSVVMAAVGCVAILTCVVDGNTALAVHILSIKLEAICKVAVVIPGVINGDHIGDDVLIANVYVVLVNVATLTAVGYSVVISGDQQATISTGGGVKLVIYTVVIVVALPFILSIAIIAEAQVRSLTAKTSVYLNVSVISANTGRSKVYAFNKEGLVISVVVVVADLTTSLTRIDAYYTVSTALCTVYEDVLSSINVVTFIYTFHFGRNEYVRNRL